MTEVYPRHCCPACGRRQSWSRLNVRAWILARWKCEACSMPLCIDSRRRLMIGALFVLWGFFCLLCGMFCVFVLGTFGWTVSVACGDAHVVGCYCIARLDRIAIAKPVGQAPADGTSHASPKDADFCSSECANRVSVAIQSPRRRIAECPRLEWPKPHL
jgi:hypothetical protein